MKKAIGEEVLNRFFYNYLILNNIEEVDKLIFKKFKGVGTSQLEIAETKDEFLSSIKDQIKNLKGKMSFYIKNYTEDQIGNIISSYCEVKIIYYCNEEKRIDTRLTTVFYKEDENWKILSMHNSIGETSQKRNGIFPENVKMFFENKDKIIYLPTKSKKGFFKLEEINYIIYSSSTRKVIFYLRSLENFEIKRNFSEVEEKLRFIADFYKLDRGTIINLENIEILDFKEERICFKNKQNLYISRIKLKELEFEWMKIKEFHKIEI